MLLLRLNSSLCSKCTGTGPETMHRLRDVFQQQAGWQAGRMADRQARDEGAADGERGALRTAWACCVAESRLVRRITQWR